jgi:mannan endo-1,6-alpha-mannosidase
MQRIFLSLVAWMTSLIVLVHGLTLDLTSQDSIKDVTSTIAYDMMTTYIGNESGQTPGLLPGPCASDLCYYWWEAGAMFGALINYWQYTGDTSYNAVVSQGLLFQIGPDQNYNPPNQSSDMGVDDQLFWAFSALDAAEANFPNPPEGQPSWLALAQAVFNFQAALWDTTTCGGGLRWQVYSYLAGYNLKNAIANAGNFQLAARLARYTGNQTYADWADMLWNWMAESPLIQVDGNSIYIWDSTDSNNNCTNADHDAWTYNWGALLMGTASMYNYTNGNSTWLERTEMILNGAYAVFFPSDYGSNIMSEIECEPTSICDSDQSSFKAYLSRWMAVTSVIVPSLAPLITPKLQASAMGAAGQCIGGDNGRLCGRRWYSTTWDGSQGVGQQMCALSVIGANLIPQTAAPLTAGSGGTSQGNPSAGSGVATGPSGVVTEKITTADKAGAGILTVLVIFGVVGGSWWLCV